MNDWVAGFIFGIVTFGAVQAFALWWMSRPLVPKMPKDYRRICSCQSGQ